MKCMWLFAGLLLVLLLLVSGCATTSPAPNSGQLQALQDAIPPIMREHAEALLIDGGDKSVVTGSKLLAALEAGLSERE